ncbi:hypothetical protein [Symbiopectobacterium purcellii]|uniref:hypothetical protein n=1 Tax=Symbiopectobacterium purcellii TaxID=2871826 RepID=UPI003F86680D
MSKIITAEFKCETAKLVLDQNYTYQEAAKAMNVSLSAALLNKSELADRMTPSATPVILS